MVDLNTLKITFKTPDAVYTALNQYFEDHNIDEDDNLRERAEEVLNKYIRWGECITIEFDLDTGKATVVNVR